MSDLEHFDQELYAVDARIARLGIACGVDLGNRDVIVALIKGNYAVCPHANMVKRDELRGLLMLKYDIEERCIESIGTDQCHYLIEEKEAKLRKRGLKA